MFYAAIFSTKPTLTPYARRRGSHDRDGSAAKQASEAHASNADVAGTERRIQ